MQLNMIPFHHVLVYLRTESETSATPVCCWSSAGRSYHMDRRRTGVMYVWDALFSRSDQCLKRLVDFRFISSPYQGGGCESRTGLQADKTQKSKEYRWEEEKQAEEAAQV